jgi:transposase
MMAVMALTVTVEVPPRDREVLRSWLRSTSIRAGLAQRARIVLLAAEGAGTNEIVALTGASKPTVIAWKKRYAVAGVGGLEDRPRPGRPRSSDDVAIVLATLEPPPERLGVTHWSSRLLARELGVSNVKVADVWREYGMQPWRRQTFKFSTDPQLEAKVRDIVGLYLDPPEKAVVVCVDEKSQIQALDRTAPILPIRPGLPEKATHDYVRHGTTTLFAALEVATGKVTDACYPQHRHQEFLRFLKMVTAAYPGVELHVVCDNYATQKHPQVKAWLAKNPRVTLHFTPTSGSWLNMVEIFFGIITRQAIRRGTHRSVKDLTAAIGAFIDGWNERCQPFTWTKTADELFPHCTPGKKNSRDTRSRRCCGAWRACAPVKLTFTPHLCRLRLRESDSQSLIFGLLRVQNSYHVISRM